MKKVVVMVTMLVMSALTLLAQNKLQVTERDMTGIIFRYVDDNETVVEVKSNVKLEFESTMDKTVNVYRTYEDNGFFFYELLFPTNPINVPVKFDGRKLQIKSYGYDTYTQPLDLKAKVPVGLLVISETKLRADDFYNAGKFSDALKEYEMLFSINPKDEYVKSRINSCNDHIKPKEDTSPKLNFIFKGIVEKINPDVKLYFDNQLIGQGNFNEGFNIKCPDVQGKHEMRVVWSGNISSKSFKINTNQQKAFEFYCEKDGFGRYICYLLKK